MYGAPTAHQPLEWQWVEDRLREAGTFWVAAVSDGYPHPRPVWGVWYLDLLHLSIGTPSVHRGLLTDSRLTVHLDSGTDVVIIEGRAAAASRTSAEVLQVYDSKYDWTYDVEQYGNLTELHPETIVAWRAFGRAGRDGFAGSGKWVFGQ